MPIRFTCSSCGRVLSTASRKAGQQIDCPACCHVVTVEPIQSLAEIAEPVREAPPAVPCAFLAEEVHDEQPIWRHQGLFAAIGVVIMVVTVVLWLGLRNPGAGLTDAAGPIAEAQPQRAVPPTAPESSPVLQRSQPEAQPQPSIVESKPQTAPEPAVLVSKPAEAKQEIVVPAPAIVVAAPAPVATPPEPAQNAKPVNTKRRHELSDEDLRKQLVAAPEVSLDLRSAQAVLSFSRLSQQQGWGADGAAFLLKQRPDFHALPMRMGADCHLGKEPAENLQVLSRKLRAFVEASIPKETADVRPDSDRLRSYLLSAEGGVSVNSTLAGRRVTNMVSGGTKEWLVPEAIPTLQQLLMSESKPVRVLLVDLLAQVKGKEATIALAQRSLFDLAPEVRDAATNALKKRALEEARPTLVNGLRYPWAAVADHAAEALVKLNDRAAVPLLVRLLKEPDPKLPALRQRGGKGLDVGPELSQAPAGLKEVAPPKDTLLVREVVRINHMSNCLLCHAVSFDSKDDVRGRVPIPGQPLPSPASTPAYYEGNTGTFVRADITYLKQDFSVNQPVANPGQWPNQQRFDYLLRTRVPTQAEFNELSRYKEAVKKGAEPTYPQREAVLYALRYLTGKDAGSAYADWDCLVRAEE